MHYAQLDWYISIRYASALLDQKGAIEVTALRVQADFVGRSRRCWKFEAFRMACCVIITASRDWYSLFRGAFLSLHSHPPPTIRMRSLQTCRWRKDSAHYLNVDRTRMIYPQPPTHQLHLPSGTFSSAPIINDVYTSSSPPRGPPRRAYLAHEAPSIGMTISVTKINDMSKKMSMITSGCHRSSYRYSFPAHSRFCLFSF